ncbi:MAG: hypothetical protein H7257_07900 [Taibaiella sp.]|nr:hypothetical protein [Taibaiella sp.]
MLKEGAIVLTIEGKASSKVIKKFIPGYVSSKNSGWYFVDFATHEVPLNTRFDVLLEGESKKLISGPGSMSIKLVGCLDQFGNKLSTIPRGYNTICKLNFSSQTPSIINRLLPTLAGWDYNPNALSIARHVDIELATPDVIWNDMFTIIYFDIKSRFSTRHISRFSRNEFTTYLEGIYHTQLHADKILESLMQLGKVTKQKDDLMEFVEQESY